MKTKTITLYSAKELQASFPKAYEKAREEYSDANDSFWGDDIVRDFLSIARLMGFSVEEKDVQWSGFYSQGDGASFTGSAQFDPDALAKVKDYAPQDEKLHAIAAECAEYGSKGLCVSLSRISHHYSHAGTVALNDVWLEIDGERYDDPGDVDTARVLETCRSLMQWLYRQLEREYQYRSGDECFLETCEANDWTFTADGRMENA